MAQKNAIPGDAHSAKVPKPTTASNKLSRICFDGLYETSICICILESGFSNPSTFQLQTVDILPEQQYFFEKNLLPFDYVSVETENG
ncbi:MAG: hypothetical protein M1587_07455 [Thaumarchaeota archaeon]|nr:hypothetical protein [Nitrososphaerota archaeon]